MKRFPPFGWLVAAGALLAFRSASDEPAAGAVQGWTFALRQDGRLQARFAGETAVPLALRQFRVRGLRVETFRADGERDIVGVAPACEVSFTEGNSFLVTSPGPLEVTQADGRFTVSGEGFRWNHETQRLTLTNNVRTLLRLSLPGSETPAPASP